MKLDVYSLANEKVGEVEVSDAVFATEVKPYLFHEVVRMQLANRRRGTHQTKSRADVSGGGAKPFRQKGTGRARQGTSRSVQMVGGGHAFARKPIDYSYKLNKKKRRLALRCALSMLVQEGTLKVVDSLEFETARTQYAAGALKGLDVAKAIVVDGSPTDDETRFTNNENLRLSIRNLPKYKYLRPDGVNVYDILRFGALVVTEKALKGLEARLDR